MTKKSSNANLRKANKNKNDEFYTQLSDIEKELGHYKEHFKGKTIFCNCDDPKESNFFKYFALNFTHLGLKKLISTHYETEKPSYKLEITDGLDLNNDGKIDLSDIQKINLKQNGDFRSPECVEILKSSDIVITNPPFSLFREYIAQLMEFEKKFIILGNMNAITYKEIFKLIKENKIWAGYGFNMSLVFKSTYENNLVANLKFCEQKGYFGKNYIKTPAINWFTNIETKKRHEEMILYKTYNEKEYPKYDNYDAINIDKVKDIPTDYDGFMGVPITFLDKYNPEQFEIIGLGISNSGIEIGVKPYKEEHKKYRKEVQKRGAVDGDLYMIKNGIVDVPYARVIIKKILK
ncbi:MAG: adenine-specific methyltransferase EcoRI family protein [Candidatus Gracilibacteria bacterium]|nr:adenine-specific methyltransferase EcoRI family protein [Candidatus Gracilibacteria bacterium]